MNRPFPIQMNIILWALPKSLLSELEAFIRRSLIWSVWELSERNSRTSSSTKNIRMQSQKKIQSKMVEFLILLNWISARCIADQYYQPMVSLWPRWLISDTESPGKSISWSRNSRFALFEERPRNLFQSRKLWTPKASWCKNFLLSGNLDLFLAVWLFR